jgi:hypothetical protein
MCMILFDKTRRPRRHRVGKNYFRKNKDGMIIAYKMVTVDNRAPFMVGGEYLYRPGVNESSRNPKYDKTLRKSESCTGEVDFGFHVAARRSDVETMRQAAMFERWTSLSSHTDLKVVRVLVDPKDVIAEGTFNLYGKGGLEYMLNLVCSKLTYPDDTDKPS